MKRRLSTASFLQSSYWSATPIPSAAIASKVGLLLKCVESHFEVKNGKISVWKDYFDMAQFQPVATLIDRGLLDTTAGRFVAQIAGRLMGQGMATLQDTGAFDDPVRIEAETLVQMRVGDHGIRHVTPRAHDLDAGQPATTRTSKG